jgi:osmotically-inducible protein OsmY
MMEVEMKTDSQLHKDVLDALTFEPSLNAAHIGIAVNEGVVTLTGDVASFADHWTAERVTKRVAGVRGFVEDIQVRLPEHHQRTDTEIAQAVLASLEWDVNVPHEALQVKVADAWVTLTGNVDWQYQKNHAESAARFLTGVRGVTNIIQVKPHVTPQDVQAKIEQAFDRQAHLDANRIRVDVSGGSVTLRGHVTSYAERDDAEHAAWSAAGVTEVKNEIMVEPWLEFSAVEAQEA